MSLIELRNVSKRFGHLRVLDGVSIVIEEASSTVIIGASGSGKSVLLKHIVGLIQPDSGEVWFDGSRIDILPERRMIPIRRQIGFLFQMGALFDSQTVAENVAFPLIEHTSRTRDEISRIVQESLALVGLPDVATKMPAQLSGGQRKRVALARAIALRPKVIIYDEPTTGLDPIRADVINELILKLQSDLNTTSLVVTHDMTSAFKVADRIVMLHDGKLIFDGSPDQIRASREPIVHRFIQGEAGEEELAALQ